ncbi:MAG: phosphate acyltransferase PlsX [Actinobacteria bacterium]|nr:phosphate acyltransferase PlsX [Actinomycetota bacterium]
MRGARGKPYVSPHWVTDAWSAITDDRVVRVVVDAAGGDNAPDEVVRGALDAVGPQLHVVFVGDEERIRALLPDGVQYVSVVHAPDAIGYHEEPATAARTRTSSSIVIGLRMVHEGEADAFVSAGNTGAVVAASVLYVRRIPGVKRPAICTIMPAMPAPVAFLDVGANAECRAEFLRQFAIMGQAFAREVMSIPEPTVGLLSIGEEPSKGTPEVIEAHRLIADDARIAHFYGNVEGRDIMNRLVDVIVTDGWTGNVGLKTIEGSAKAIIGALRATIMLNPKTKLGGLLLQKDLQILKDALNPEEFGGALLVGMNAPVVIAHGNSRARGIAQAVRMGRRGVVTDLLPTIARELGSKTASV